VTTRVGVVLFPGSNCEHDVVRAVRGIGGEADIVWHAATDVDAYDVIVLPGGFAHGDYLRAGALARFAPVMAAVADFAAAGGPVVGICNGFQVLTEAGLLPGALQKNAHLRFVCAPSAVRVDSTKSVLTRRVALGTELVLPVNHFVGRFVCDEATLAELVAEERVILRYLDNPNGSIDDIAGICNREGNVVGLMPHPERAADKLVGGVDGALLLGSLLEVAGVFAA
jgi:phosphoribosylformylglycinamidine synthase subunit PurQ / glutaminase